MQPQRSLGVLSFSVLTAVKRTKQMKEQSVKRMFWCVLLLLLFAFLEREILKIFKLCQITELMGERKKVKIKMKSNKEIF